jgi:hypothetical protein
MYKFAAFLTQEKKADFVNKRANISLCLKMQEFYSFLHSFGPKVLLYHPANVESSLFSLELTVALILGIVLGVARVI